MIQGHVKQVLAGPRGLCRLAAYAARCACAALLTNSLIQTRHRAKPPHLAQRVGVGAHVRQDDQHVVAALVRQVL